MVYGGHLVPALEYATVLRTERPPVQTETHQHLAVCIYNQQDFAALTETLFILLGNHHSSTMH